MTSPELTPEDHDTIATLRSSADQAREFFEQHREELRRMVSLRMDRRLARRLDPSDVVQEAFVRYTGAVESYLQSVHKPPLIWLRFFVRKVLSRLTRKHLESQCRDVHREAVAEVDIEQISDSLSSLASGLHQAELRAQLQQIFSTMSNIDREVLALVHIEGKTIAAAAQELQIEVEAAKKRYRRAVNRLAESPKKQVLEAFNA